MPLDPKPPLDLCNNLTPDRVADYVNKNMSDELPEGGYLSGVGSCTKDIDIDDTQCFHLSVERPFYPRKGSEIRDCIHTPGYCSFTPTKRIPLKVANSKIEDFCSSPYFDTDDEICNYPTAEHYVYVNNKRGAKDLKANGFGNNFLIKDNFLEFWSVERVYPCRGDPSNNCSQSQHLIDTCPLMNDFKRKCGMDLPEACEPPPP